ncbi:hypothetical protein TTHERM_000805880 (macronuclear) [Tetrahymena thermophila SB210]|uniref:Uncharacterized protein n=1 Tax=Tetrahymena thermophila (strain SB210) TaxID=312017 RepID=W7XD75_TETTS|nr:hypothetical protein TTHERM_000805880 [Tetrahymena thermophila SB210]EWS75452.1 hypothetical protein TTHERM_000805880 [Tetrahymena thermophila SB210]|eukprot:XP_012651999.1 hypothetical protein TTHERM_000805880 [Tetrahymena thermophila SB210]
MIKLTNQLTTYHSMNKQIILYIIIDKNLIIKSREHIFTCIERKKIKMDYNSYFRFQTVQTFVYLQINIPDSGLFLQTTLKRAPQEKLTQIILLKKEDWIKIYIFSKHNMEIVLKELILALFLMKKITLQFFMKKRKNNSMSFFQVVSQKKLNLIYLEKYQSMELLQFKIYHMKSQVRFNQLKIAVKETFTYFKPKSIYIQQILIILLSIKFL